MEEQIATPYRLSTQEVLDFFKVTIENGLSDSQVAIHREKYGTNQLEHEEKKSILSMILEQFEDTLVRILLAAATVSFLLVFFDDESPSSLTAYVEPLVILLILIANACVGIWQENNAEEALHALKKMQPDLARVLRNGQFLPLPSAQLVCGDIVEVRVGDKVPADIRLLLLRTASLRTAEPQLTGESDAIDKHTLPESSALPLKPRDQHNMLFCTSTIVGGSALGVVCYVGMEMEIGKIQRDVQNASTEDQSTPLSRKIDEFGELLTKIISLICIFVFVINYRNFFDPHHKTVFRACIYYFKISVALAVAAIPEGLPAVITTCLALGTRRMAAKSVIVRRLPSVETLGCTTVICSDKTGTLTCGKMNVTQMTTFKGDMSVWRYVVSGMWHGRGEEREMVRREGEGEREKEGEKLDMILSVCRLCNDSKIVKGKEGDEEEYVCMGEPTEGALLGFANKVEREREEKLSSISPLPSPSLLSLEKLATLEFSRQRKSMSVLCRDSSTNKNILLVKGAPEALLNRTSSLYVSRNESIPMTSDLKRSIMKEINLMASKGLRTLALAIKKDLSSPLLSYNGDTSHPGHSLLSNVESYSSIEDSLIFLSLIAINDPPRPFVQESIEKCHSAGIRVVMITGDNKLTAEAIAKDIGILPSSYVSPPSPLPSSPLTLSPLPRSFEGSDWEKLSPEDRTSLLSSLSLSHPSLGIVFSRTEPEHKLQIVKTLKSLGEIVAMTGDGVNDASALKIADIGIAMGITGTEVAKESSDMILANDNFNNIVIAIEEGRTIYNNMKAFIRYLISSNIGEVASIFLTALLNIPEGLLPVQLLWINLVTDGLPAAALGFNPSEYDVMKRKPRSRSDQLINLWLFLRYMIIGVYVGLATVGIFVYWYVVGIEGSNNTLVTWNQLTSWSKCPTWKGFEVELVQGMNAKGGIGEIDYCDYFSGGKIKASTLSLTVLVMIEMFNALNALSQDGSLLRIPPWKNWWLCLAIVGSVALHLVILYVPFLAGIFNVVPLGKSDWVAVILFSLPVILIDEVLKLVSRVAQERERKREREERDRGEDRRDERERKGKKVAEKHQYQRISTNENQDDLIQTQVIGKTQSQQSKKHI